MFNLTVKLSTVKDVQEFVNVCTSHDMIDIDIVSGRYVVDAKSIMGIFSFNLSKPLTLNIYAEKSEATKLVEDLSKFTC